MTDPRARRGPYWRRGAQGEDGSRMRRQFWGLHWGTPTIIRRKRSVAARPGRLAEVMLGGLDVQSLPGGHMEIVRDPVAALTARAIESALDELGGGPEAEIRAARTPTAADLFPMKASGPPGAASSRSAIAQLTTTMRRRTSHAPALSAVRAPSRAPRKAPTPIASPAATTIWSGHGVDDESAEIAAEIA